MKFFRVLTLAAVAAAVPACEQDQRSDDNLEQLHQMNAFAVNGYHDEEMRNAVISQRTIFPYHYIPDSAQFNELGRYETGVLARHFRDHPGRVNIRRGDVDDALYQSRVKAVTDAMADAGVDASRVTVTDALPEGEGMPAYRAVEIIENRARLGAADVPERTVAPTPTIREQGVR